MSVKKSVVPVTGAVQVGTAAVAVGAKYLAQIAGTAKEEGATECASGEQETCTAQTEENMEGVIQDENEGGHDTSYRWSRL